MTPVRLVSILANLIKEKIGEEPARPIIGIEYLKRIGAAALHSSSFIVNI
jgi:hypothetical protein